MDGVLPSDAREILKKLEEIKENIEVQAVGKKVRTLLNILQFDLDIPNDAEIKRQINEIRANADKVLYRDIVELLPILEKFDFKKEAFCLANTWKKALSNDSLNKFIQSPFTKHRQREIALSQPTLDALNALEKSKINHSVNLIVINAYLKDILQGSSDNELKQIALSWIMEDKPINPSALEEIAKQSLSFWKELFKKTKTLGYIVNFLEERTVTESIAKESVVEALRKTIREYLKALSKQSEIYKKCYAKYLLTPAQQVLKEMGNELLLSRNPLGMYKKKPISDEWEQEDAAIVFALFDVNECLLITNNFWDPARYTAKSLLSFVTKNKEILQHDEHEFVGLSLNFGKMLYSYLKGLNQNSTVFQKSKIKELIDAHPWEELVAEAKRREVPSTPS
ncbi:hypothetical protein FAI40_03785 [Acetobacteraceae bacterium]|nr:hypothetical protein FAI40_03785 [Acetobacteraceae bacterium]